MSAVESLNQLKQGNEESDQFMMVSMETLKTTMLLVTLVVVLMMGLVDGCERRGEELICQGELPTLDAKEVRER